MFTTAATPFKDGTHLVDLEDSIFLTVCGASVTSTSARRDANPHPDWFSCRHCRAVARERHDG